MHNQSSQEISEDEDFASNEQSTPVYATVASADPAAKISKEEEERLK